ncbi:photosynthetic reaction center cytochrome c subunit [Rhodocyclus tenuis]|uniref:Photosynthetic reaction center cytochrome c subunit n=2 Tax=Rhodocyclus TaxID=1064 RepID=A0A6L5K2K2_RHOTE|nr:photosynthetic reaction center cytochrome PufC [Rhodocyclus gracilis]MQY52768.1 photosynthetic reaction center cytochrome c subunit [Rhodocyclus gracilis]MRD74193.1 photosynthetic reaction center cytochrome c subunit [Rhodocyclus gracilis]NJA90250.1 photosynthetic reaction center cytochrome c subunit [Rhodocyclus gracilis]
MNARNQKLAWAAGALGLITLTAGCDKPPLETVQPIQRGYRGLGMVEMYSPATVAALAKTQQSPAAAPAVPGGGPLAASIYQNVQVLKDLDIGEFNRLMVSITQWVAPEQGCSYCHADGDLAADTVYTKVVARRMLEMTRHINSDWKPHVAETGVTCYTCHQGKPVPQNIWFADAGPKGAGGLMATRGGQNTPAPAVGLTSLPFDPFSMFLEKATPVAAISKTALPVKGANPADVKSSEATLGLMMHISKSLGVNCTYCHNTRSFAEWSSSTPQRVTAWHGIRMVRDLNVDYLNPLRDTFPAKRLGPQGDGPKVNCATCHNGVYKPLYGVSLLKDYPALKKPAAKVAPAAAPAAVEAEAPAPAGT